MMHRWILCCLIVASASCASLKRTFGGDDVPRTPKDAEETRHALDLADRDFAAGRTQTALDRAVMCRETTGLPTELRNEVESKLETFAEKRIDELSAKGSDPDALVDMVELNLPRTLAVRAGVRGAELALDQGHPYDAYKALKKVDVKFPNHHERVRAGEILAEAGAQLSRDGWSFLGFFKTADKGAEVLEYLVVNYPKERRCDEAYSILAKHYADGRDWELARERCEDLILYHSDSSLASWAEASVPHYRLLGSKSPEYDRRELIRARGELEQWLKRHADASGKPDVLEHEVRIDYADCLIRLCRSDMGIARFYRRIERQGGAALHAERALEEAKTSGDAALLAEASELRSSIAAMPAEKNAP